MSTTTTALTASEVSTQDWPTKGEAAQALQVSTKTVEKYVQDGKLIQRMQSQINKPARAVIDPESISKMIESRASEQSREVVATNSQNASQNASQSLIVSVLQGVLSELREGVREGLLIGFENHSWPLPMYLSIGGAVRYTGLGAEHIQLAAREGKIAKMGRKYRRSDLDNL